jgi:hypothetical protein
VGEAESWGFILNNYWLEHFLKGSDLVVKYRNEDFAILEPSIGDLTGVLDRTDLA